MERSENNASLLQFFSKPYLTVAHWETWNSLTEGGRKERPLCAWEGIMCQRWEPGENSPGALAHTSTGMKNRPQHHMSVTQDLLGCKAECLAGKVSKNHFNQKKLFCPYRQHQLSMIKMHMTGLCVPYFKINCFIFHSRDFFGGSEGGKKIGVLYGLRRHAESRVQ